MNNQGNKALRQNLKSPENKYMKICDLNERKLKTAIMKKLNEIPKTTGRQFNELRNQQTKEVIYQIN